MIETNAGSQDSYPIRWQRLLATLRRFVACLLLFSGVIIISPYGALLLYEAAFGQASSAIFSVLMSAVPAVFVAALIGQSAYRVTRTIAVTAICLEVLMLVAMRLLPVPLELSVLHVWLWLFSFLPAR